jgi:hypothetical protein
MTCTNCGSALMQPSTFCSTCGQLITTHSYQYQYSPSDDDTAEFPAIPAMAAYDYSPAYEPAPGYSPPPFGYGTPVSPAVGYYAQQPAYAYAQQVGHAPNEGYGAPGQPYAGAPAAYDHLPVEVEPIAEPPPPVVDQTPQVYGTATQPPDNRLSTVAFVLAGLAVVFLPFVLGLAAIVVSNNAAKQGERLAPLAFKASLAGTAIGCFLGGLVLWLI